jgi:3-oxoacyl-[acyl-carrier protein] reductase
MMTDQLRGKVAVVTGGGGGIGKQAALALASEGAQVLINDVGRDAEGRHLADLAVAEVQAQGGRAAASYDSVATPRGGQNIAELASASFGRLDILVNCAGNFIYRLLVDMTEEGWDSQVDVHLKGHFNCIHAAVPTMIEQGSGQIINISSRAAFGDPAGGLAYAAAKAGVMGATVQLSRELRECGVAVNCILPSADTPLFPKSETRRGLDVPATSSVDAACVAPLVVYLATQPASKLTGRFFYACGGDVGVYHHPLRVRTSARTQGSWTVDELEHVLPSLLLVRD